MGVSAGEPDSSYTHAGYCLDLSSSSGETEILRPSRRAGCCKYVAAPPTSVAAAAAAAYHLLDAKPEVPLATSPTEAKATAEAVLAADAVCTKRCLSDWCDRKGGCPKGVNFCPVGRWRSRTLNCIYQQQLDGLYLLTVGSSKTYRQQSGGTSCPTQSGKSQVLPPVVRGPDFTTGVRRLRYLQDRLNPFPAV